MKKQFLFAFLLLFFVAIPFLGICSTEVTYPTLPGVVSPQDIVREVEREEDVLPLFITYIFNLLLIVSAIVAVVIIIYGGFLFITASDDPEKKQNAKKWVLSAFQGAIIVLLSYTILFTLDSRLVLFRQIDLDEQDSISGTSLEWEVSNIYFQIPLGPLLEDALLNNNGKSKLNDVFLATKKAEETADDIRKASIELMEIIDSCEIGDECCEAKYHEEGIGGYDEDNLLYEIVTDRIAEEGCFPVDSSGGPRYTSYFGPRKLFDASFHYGVDIAATTGTPVRATHEGEVVFSGSRGGRGNTVIVEHIIDGKAYSIFYTHLHSISVKTGDKVSPGSGIGTVGSTGRSTGPHLHYEVRNPQGKAIDPIAAGFLSKSISNYCAISLPVFSKESQEKSFSLSVSRFFSSSLFGKNVFATDENPPDDDSSVATVDGKQYVRFYFSTKCPTGYTPVKPWSQGIAKSTCGTWPPALASICCELTLNPKPTKDNVYRFYNKMICPPAYERNGGIIDFECGAWPPPALPGTGITPASSVCCRGIYEEDEDKDKVDEKCENLDNFPKEHSDIEKDDCDDEEKCKWNDDTSACCCQEDYDGENGENGENGETNGENGEEDIIEDCSELGAGWDNSDDSFCTDGKDGYQCQMKKTEDGGDLCCCISDDNVPDDFCPEADSDPESHYVGAQNCSIGDTEIDKLDDLVCCKIGDSTDNGNGIDEGCNETFPNESAQQMCDNHPENCQRFDGDSICCCDNNIDIIEKGCSEEFPKEANIKLCEDQTEGCEFVDTGDGEMTCCCREDVLEDIKCTDEDDCPDGYICVDGVCVDGHCPDGECPEGYECVDSFCRKKCTDEDDCPDGYICVDGVCVDGHCPDGECPEGYECVDGFCRKKCTDEDDCPDGYICVDGVCVDGHCPDGECPEGYECVDGFCVKLECVLDTDCPPGYVCINNVCEERSGCPPCPKINHLILSKIEELERYMDTLNKDLILLLSTKEPLKEDLYNLYKVLMLKSLGYQKVVNYVDFLTERLYYSTMDVGLVTDTEKSDIGNYSWNWSKWLFNITYIIETDGVAIPDNDPATFFLKKPMSDVIIEDALRLAQEAKQNDIQSLGKDGLSDINKEENNQSLLQKFAIFIKDTFVSIREKVVLVKEVLAQTELEKIKSCLEEKVGNDTLSTSECASMINNCMEEHNINEAELSLTDEERREIFDKCNIEDISLNGDLVASRLSCGMEIPIGEAVEIAWNHLMDILFTIDEYELKAKELVEKQDYMNELSRPCECVCEDGVSCPEIRTDEDCGECDLTCDKEAIRTAHEEVLKTREELEVIAREIYTLTDGFYNEETEDVCHYLNEDIRSEEEKERCDQDEEILITKHELVLRKLNYSRSEFNKCLIRPEDIDDVLTGRISGKTLFFGPVAEEYNLPRYTKTREGGEMMNTSNFNWFCCTD